MRIRPLVFFLGCFLQLAAQQGPALLGTLPEAIAENSGLIFYNGLLIAHNDSGNEPVLYEIDTTNLQIVRSVTVLNATNTDWEDIAQDDSFIYIGDIGNDNGSRQDLKVYRISKADFQNSDAVEAEVIAFSYANQSDFGVVQKSDWDAEALITSAGRLMVFTKQWQEYGTTAYVFPASPGTHLAQPAGNFQSNGLITGAVFNEATGTTYLCGYDLVLQPFLVRIEHFDIEAPFAGTPLKTKLEFGLGQVEAITNIDAGRYFFSTEKFVNSMPPVSLAASLYAFHVTEDGTAQPPANPPSGQEPPDTGDSGKTELLIYTPYGSREVEYQLNRSEPLYGRAIFDMQGRRILFTHAAEIENPVMDLSALESAVYNLVFFLEGKTLAKPFFLN
jgi:hypothetical protein